MADIKARKRWVFGGAVALSVVAAFSAGLAWDRTQGAPPASDRVKAAPKQDVAAMIADGTSNDIMAVVDAQEASEAADLTDAIDKAATDAQRTVEAMQFDDEPATSANLDGDDELRVAQRQAVELNEMICKQTGQNCEAAAMARRHYSERYGNK